MITLRLVTITLAAIVLLLTGCGDDDLKFRANPEATVSEDDAEIAKAIANLALGDKTDDPESSVLYDKARDSLAMRGAKIESHIIDTLRRNPDANVRIGCIEVLGSIASKAAIAPLIAVLDDEVPLVARQADITLRVLTGTRMIPEAGAGPKDGLPPVPAGSTTQDVRVADTQAWATWHSQHREALKAAWERWWVDHKANFKMP
ncbi:MAG: HEAT repeat domain-containing protein [Planctomycetota bacterium]